MGWASGFSAGTSMAKQWMDTYEQAKRRRLNEGIQTATPYERNTAEYGQYVADKIAAQDEFNRPLFDVSIKPGATKYDIRPIQYSSSPAQIPQADIDYAAWERKYGGLGPQRDSAQVSTSPVPMDGLDVRTVLDSDAPGYGRDRTPVNQGLGFYPAMSATEMAPQAYRDLVAPDLGYTPTLQPRTAPEETAAYQGLTRGQGRVLGEALPYAPTKTVYLGKEYDTDKFTPEVRRAAQLEAYADVIARDNPLEAERLRIMASQEKRAAAAETRAAELFPIQKESLTIELDEKKFTAEERKKTRALEDFIAANPNLPTKDIVAKAQELKLGPKVQAEAIKQLTGVTTADMEHSKALIASKIKDMSFDDMLAEHKNNDMISPGSHYEAVRDAKGNVALYMVDTATGKRTTDTPDFTGSVQEADQYLRRAALDMSSLLDFTMNVKKFQSEVEKNQAAAYEARQKGDYYSKGGSGSSSAGATREYVAMVGEARMLSTEIERLTGIVNDKTADPKLRKNAEARLNDALDQYKEVSGAIRGMRGLGGGGGGGGGGEADIMVKVGVPFRVGDKWYVADRDSRYGDLRPEMVKESTAQGSLPSQSENGLQKESSTTPPLANRLAAAAKKDAGRSDKYFTRELAQSVERDLPNLVARVNAMRNSLQTAKTDAERATIQGVLTQLEQDLAVANSLVLQNKNR